MARMNSIQWKALLLLVVFTGSFTIFCHCANAASSSSERSCCEKKTDQKPNDHGCQGMQAVKFNLLEKQAAASVHAGASPVVILADAALVLLTPPSPVIRPSLPATWSRKHSPPDRLSLYQCFLI
jgi:hypothetical protein